MDSETTTESSRSAPAPLPGSEHVDEGASRASGRRVPSGYRHAVAALALAMLVAAGAWAYYRFVYYPTTPQCTLDRFFAAERGRDFDALYGMVHVTGILKAAVPNAAALRAAADRFPNLIPDVVSYRFGEARVIGDRALVETTARTRTPAGAKENAIKVEMVKVNGVWMIDGNWIGREALQRGMGGALIKGSEL